MRFLVSGLHVSQFQSTAFSAVSTDDVLEEFVLHRFADIEGRSHA